MSYALIHRPAGRLDLATFCRITGTHPDLVRRFVALGLLNPERDADDALWFGREQMRALGRIRRLRTGFGLNYAALDLVMNLLDRIAELERTNRSEGRPWT
ncbi:chaperone modulator CbpM [Actinoplanes sp. NPDC051411]|uniref:chaperone modulator CbpM n=1 Tax=Actinoplanes sp. NPDC051411 TaxID=3155522 RepID=UPI003414BF2D